MDSHTNANLDTALTLEGFARSVVCAVAGVAGVVACASMQPILMCGVLASGVVALVGLAGLVGGLAGLFTRN